jgi:hypothetical protein
MLDMGTAGWETHEIRGTWIEGLYSGTAASLLLRTHRVDLALPYCMSCGDPNAPALTTGARYGSTPPPNQTGKLTWTLTPRGAVLGGLMSAIAAAREHDGGGTMQELTFGSADTGASEDNSNQILRIDKRVLDSDGALSHTTADVDQTTAVCGRVGVGAAGTCIHSQKRSTACACRSLCAQRPQCKAWQWIQASSAADHTTCYLKSVAHVEPNTESISGECPNTNSSCPSPPPLPRLIGWAFRQQENVVIAAFILHLAPHPVTLDVSELIGLPLGMKPSDKWQVSTQFQRAGAAALLGNMSSVVTEVRTLDPGQGSMLTVPAYAVVKLARL